MHSFVTAAGFALGASAALLPRNDGCCFQLTASGGASGTLGQLGDGQNRVGGGYGAAQYCINNGQITDGSGRGCILTAPTTQFQCDTGASPAGGFSVGGNGMLEHNGDSTFYACPADEGEYNIYTQPVDNMPKCVKVSLSTGGKCGGGQASSSPAGGYSMSSPAGGQSMSSPAGGQQTCPPAQTVYKTQTEQGKASTIYKTETQQAKPTTVYKTETVQNTQYKPTTVIQTKTVEETETATKPTTTYQTKTVQSTVTAEQPTTIYKTQTQEETETKTVPTTIYQTKTQQTTVTAEIPTTVYKTSTVMETQTVPTTAYETKTIQNTVTAETPTTVYQTKTEEQTETKPVTQYQTKTVQSTVTAQQPTTIYKTEEQTQYKPTTAYETKTIQDTVTAQQPTTVYKTKTIEETETAKAPAQTVTKIQTQYQTQQAQTVTKTEQTCQSSGQGKPTSGGNGSGRGQSTAKPSPTQQSSACPTDLNSGAYERPHLIVPVNSEYPDQSYGTSYNGKVSGSESSIFNFDIPQSYEGKTCSLVFMLPKKADLETSDYTMNGSGSISVDQLSSPAKESTSWNSTPKVASHAGSFSPQPGNSYIVSTGDCAAGTTQSYELSASGGLSLDYFQDYNPSPIGLYITTC